MSKTPLTRRLGRPAALSDAQVRWAVEEARRGATVCALARELGVHRNPLQKRIAAVLGHRRPGPKPRTRAEKRNWLPCPVCKAPMQRLPDAAAIMFWYCDACSAYLSVPRDLAALRRQQPIPESA